MIVFRFMKTTISLRVAHVVPQTRVYDVPERDVTVRRTSSLEASALTIVFSPQIAVADKLGHVHLEF